MIEGEAQLRTADDAVTLREGELLLARDVGIEFESTTATAMITASGWRQDVLRISAGFGPAAEAIRILRPSPAAVSMFAAVVNQGIAGELAADHPGFEAYWRTVEHSVSFLAQSGGSWIPEQLSPANAEVFRRSLRFMERSYRRSDLSIADICEGAFASGSSVFRAFRAAKTSPLAVLKRLRVAAARNDVEWQGAHADLALISFENGFPSMRSMKAALAA